ncbi:MAG TPA: PAS domain-containing protein [Steroidobacteraceae bacterium]|nr:PAS domain-containing protein [Steroidobacteraceae bacterium]
MVGIPITTSDFQARQAFALKLSDALRPIAEPGEVQRVAMQLLGAHMNVDRALYYRAERSELGWHHVVDTEHFTTPGTVRVSGLPRPNSDYGVELMTGLEGGENVLVYDVRNDPRLTPDERQRYAEVGIGAFIAVPLLKEGRYVGGVTVHSKAPRRWLSADLELLADVAERTWAALERSRSQLIMRENEERLRLALDIGSLASWDWDLRTGRVTWNDRHFLMQGYTVGEVTPSFEAWITRVHPDDRAEAVRRIEVARDSLTTYSHDFRALLPNGTVRWCSARGHFYYDEEGAPYRMIGVMEDFTERQRVEAALLDSERRLRENEIWLGAQKEAFRSAMGGAPLDVSLGHLVRFVTSRPGTDVRCAFYISSEDNLGLSHVIGMPEPYGSRVRGFAISPESLACGLAVALGRPIITPDVLEDPRWSPWTWLAREFDYRACWSFPVETAAGNLVGSFAMYFTEPRDAAPEDYKLPEAIAQTAAIIIVQHHAAAAIRDSEARQVFLLKLSDAVAPLTSEAAVVETAARLLCAQLQVDSVSFGEPPPGLPAPQAQPLTITDIEAEADLDDAARSAYRAAKTRALLVVALKRNGDPPIYFGARHGEPRPWSKSDVQLVGEVADRTLAAIERVRVDTGQREIQTRFRQFAAASSGALWIRDANTLAMEYASAAMAGIYGVKPGDLLGDVRKWASAIVPDDRQRALELIEQARQGVPVVHQFRIQRPSDLAFRWIRTTDFPLFDALGRVQRIGGIAEDVTEATLAVEHQGVLLLELQHRVRNILTIVRSIASRTGERAETVVEYADLLAGRLMALARVQTLLTKRPNGHVPLTTIVCDELAAKAPDGKQFTVAGPEIALAPKAAEILTMVVHELATNALKYGALSVAGGKIAVTWNAVQKEGGDWLVFDWRETGAPHHASPPDKPRRRGFGTELIEGRISYELGGRGSVDFGPAEAHCQLEFPLTAGSSVLETGAPRQANVFGGSLDMAGQPHLGGRRVLVVEDEYFIAGDTARALKGAGAEIAGPVGNVAGAELEIAKQRPDAVIVDINLGHGPSFEFADSLKKRGIPFVFATGYDEDVIPKEFDSTPRLQKPVELRQVIEAVSRLLIRPVT